MDMAMIYHFTQNDAIQRIINLCLSFISILERALQYRIFFNFMSNDSQKELSNWMGITKKSLIV